MIIKCIAKSKIDPAMHLVVSGPYKFPVDCSNNSEVDALREELRNKARIEANKIAKFPIETPLPTPTPVLTPQISKNIINQTLEQQDANGPGTKLSQILEKIGIKSSPSCSCKAKAKIMNEKGHEWCEQNIEEIVGWLKEEAKKRKLPFIDMAAKIIVRRAISLSRKAKQNEQK